MSQGKSKFYVKIKCNPGDHSRIAIAVADKLKWCRGLRKDSSNPEYWIEESRCYKKLYESILKGEVFIGAKAPVEQLKLDKLF